MIILFGRMMVWAQAVTETGERQVMIRTLYAVDLETLFPGAEIQESADEQWWRFYAVMSPAQCRAALNEAKAQVLQDNPWAEFAYEGMEDFLNNLE